ncbi:MAG: uroporphyrinogen decarboxylase family protein [Candidatus Acidiferrales bacterium]
MATPRETIKSLLQGAPVERPLIVPVVFSLGAKIENLSLRAYLDNPTKIASALRQIRTQLRSDGVACYFDPLLAFEALGGEVKWDAANQVRSDHWPEPAAKGELPVGLRTPEMAASSARVQIAADVIRRLKLLFRDEPLLMASVSGPLTLAARLMQRTPDEAFRNIWVFDPALKLAADGITRIAATLVEAGANLIFIREEFLPELSEHGCSIWQTLLAPAFNIIRFYEALPVLQLAGERMSAGNIAAILDQSWDAVVCSGSVDFARQAASRAEGFPYGVSYSAEALEAIGLAGETFEAHAGRKPVLLTTDGDVTAATDLKRLTTGFNAIAQKMRIE